MDSIERRAGGGGVVRRPCCTERAARPRPKHSASVRAHTWACGIEARQTGRCADGQLALVGDSVCGAGENLFEESLWMRPGAVFARVVGAAHRRGPPLSDIDGAERRAARGVISSRDVARQAYRGPTRSG